MVEKKPYLMEYSNNLGNEYILDEEGNLQSRVVAEKYIYNKNPSKYSKPFGAYVVHHINSKTLDNTPENLYICTREQHNLIHTEQKRRKKRFANSMELDYFIKEYRAPEQTTLPKTHKDKPKTQEKPYYNIGEPNPNQRYQQIVQESEASKSWNIKNIPRTAPILPKKDIAKDRMNKTETRARLSTELKMAGRTQVKSIIRRPIKSEVVSGIIDSRRDNRKVIPTIEQPTYPSKKPRNYLIFIAVTIIILLGIVFFMIQGIPRYEQEQINTNKKTPINPIPIPQPIPVTAPAPTPKVEPIIVTGSTNEVIITNNKDIPITLNVTYRVFSNWYGIDYTDSQIFDVDKNKTESFRVYNNNNCVYKDSKTLDCTISIISYEEIN